MGESPNVELVGRPGLAQRSTLRSVLGAVLGFLICPFLTYAPLYGANWLLPGSAIDHTIPVLLVWMALVQVLTPILLWKRSRSTAIGFLVNTGFQVLLLVAMRVRWLVSTL